MRKSSRRTQIYLPEDLRVEIDKLLKISGESLAAFLRTAAEEKLARSKKRKINLIKLADDFIGSGKGRRTDEEIEEWINDIRKERRLSDERMIKRWDDAGRNSMKSLLKSAATPQKIMVNEKK